MIRKDKTRYDTIRNKMEARSILGRYHSDNAKMNNLVYLLSVVVIVVAKVLFLLGYVWCKGG